MTFTLNRRSKRLLKKLSNKYLDDSGIIERDDNNSFGIWGKDPILGTYARVGVDINQRGNITSLDFWNAGEDEIKDYDNQFLKLVLTNPNKAVRWFQQLDIPTTPVFIDSTNPQLLADAFNRNIPGLAGGPLDVYVSIGDYSTFA